MFQYTVYLRNPAPMTDYTELFSVFGETCDIEVSAEIGKSFIKITLNSPQDLFEILNKYHRIEKV